MDDRLISPEDDPTLDVEGHGLNLGNDSETVVKDEPDVEGHGMDLGNDNETVVEDEPDVEGHSMTYNDNETIVED